LKRTRILPALASILLLAGAGAAAEEREDDFETVAATGTGASRGDALDEARKAAVMSSVMKVVKSQDFGDFTEDRVGVREVLRNRNQYLSGVRVTGEKVSLDKGGNGKGRGLVHEVAIRARVNVKWIRRDFIRAQSIAALRKHGDRIGILLHEGAKPSEHAEAEPSWAFVGAMGAERAFMEYKFRPLPMGTVRKRFREAVEGGSSLEEDAAFKEEMVEALAGVGAHLRILGRITLAPLLDRRTEEGETEKGFVASWWGEIHVGGKYERRLRVRLEKDQGAEGWGGTVEEARENAFNAAGAEMAFDLAEALARKEAAEAEEEMEEPPREVVVIVEAVPEGAYGTVEGTVRGIEGVLKVRRIRLGSGWYIAQVTTRLAPEDFLAAIRDGLEPKGFEVTGHTEKKVRLLWGG